MKLQSIYLIALLAAPSYALTSEHQFKELKNNHFALVAKQLDTIAKEAQANSPDQDAQTNSIDLSGQALANREDLITRDNKTKFFNNVTVKGLLAADNVNTKNGGSLDGVLTVNGKLLIKGIPVTGTPGPQGPTGPQGTAGTNGAPGATGATGPAGTPILAYAYGFNNSNSPQIVNGGDSVIFNDHSTTGSITYTTAPTSTNGDYFTLPAGTYSIQCYAQASHSTTTTPLSILSTPGISFQSPNVGSSNQIVNGSYFLTVDDGSLGYVSVGNTTSDDSGGYEPISLLSNDTINAAIIILQIA